MDGDRKPFHVGIPAACAVIALDQVVKWWILSFVMTPPRRIPVTGFFDLVLVMNRGVSFGMFDSAPEWATPALIVFAVLLSAVLGLWMWRAGTMLLATALGFVIGGAVGNVVDRFRFGAVVDFLDFHVAGYHWPAFNVADSAITVGVALLILDSLKTKSAKP